MRMKSGVVVKTGVFLAAFVLQAILPGYADDAYTAGVKLLTAKNFNAACQSFQSAVKQDPKNSMAYYYLGLSRHYMGDRNGAMTIYKQVVKGFPGTVAANQALSAIATLDPSAAVAAQQGRSGYPSSGSSSASQGRSLQSGSQAGAQSGSQEGYYGRSAANDLIPDETRVYFTKESNCFVFDVTVNNRPIKMLFDTGAESTVLGRNHMKELGLPVPTGKHHGEAHGVGEGGAQKVWMSKADVSLSNITRKNFPIMVQEYMPGMPLLGQTFFQDFKYTVDNAAHCIHFVKRSRDSGGSIYASLNNDRNAVPFRRMGNEIVVDTEINGKKIPMFFDTGASGVALSPEHLRQLGLEIPEDATTSMSQGIAGDTLCKMFPVSSLKVGPIEKRNFEIGVVMQSNMPYPLLGQTAYSDYQYTIDYNKKLIYFVRR
ncbi:MAG: retroviral-like aspartic protease family protein [Candidatus Obscuribacter phosphatis]|uniref:Retroviral-like aspartic protease family protein n=1 Tax=Candidatus Obscuribacter phosphatis TaxID=1906157 RepID=A0A8J7TKY3_9BACT|nr:retroviral-like aspartic protease family protein [Candidatus Obscuribacter phosphatis]